MPPAPPRAEKGLAPGAGVELGVCWVAAGVGVGAAPPISCEKMLFMFARPAAGAGAGVVPGAGEEFVVPVDVVDDDEPHGFGNGSVLTVVRFSVVPVLVLLFANDENGF